jgi:hypothetical protein
MSGVSDGEKDLLDGVGLGEVSAHAIRDQNGIAGNFGLTKSLHPLLEDAHDHKGEVIDLDVLPDRHRVATV